jgi:sterol desaturase/sphingolipid hydroxylase (fatty acid hydroxylase superfamily)
MTTPYYFILSIKTIFGLFLSSTLSAYLICLVSNYPFYNDEESSSQIIHKIKKNVTTTSVILCESVLLFTYLFRFIIDQPRHSMIISAINMSSYAILIELFYYGYHRLIHHRYLYKAIHSTHHENVIVYPIDSFYLGIVDGNGLFICLSLPVLLLHLNYFEFISVLYVYITFGYISHSTLVYTHHAIHHRLFKYNYCILLPLFDVIFHTYREKIEG